MAWPPISRHCPLSPRTFSRHCRHKRFPGIVATSVLPALSPRALSQQKCRQKPSANQWSHLAQNTQTTTNTTLKQHETQSQHMQNNNEKHENIKHPTIVNTIKSQTKTKTTNKTKQWQTLKTNNLKHKKTATKTQTWQTQNNTQMTTTQRTRTQHT